MVEIHNITVDNFKSLNNFKIKFPKFTSLIGLNGAGKSTILQAIDFVSQQMHGNITSWLNERNWEAKELNSKLIDKKLIIVMVKFTYNGDFYIWVFNFNTVLRRCTYEVIYDMKAIFKVKDSKYTGTIFTVKDSKYMIRDVENQKKLQGDIIQEYEGSFLSSLKDEFLPEPIREFKHYIQNIYSLDLLSPQELRSRSRVGSKLGLSGKNISAFLNTFSKEQRLEILHQLQKCYPNLEALDVKKSKGGWSRIELVEKFGGKKITNEAKYLNDGVLRLIAILAQLQSQKSFLLFDEIENGINAELIEFLMDTLIASKHQVMITTHSPMILNYIEDEIAKESVQYIYKTKEGFTQSIPLFNIPSMSEKLELMGAGEVYMDTDLSLLAEEIESLQVKKRSNAFSLKW